MERIIKGKFKFYVMNLIVYNIFKHFKTIALKQYQTIKDQVW